MKSAVEEFYFNFRPFHEQADEFAGLYARSDERLPLMWLID